MKKFLAGFFMLGTFTCCLVGMEEVELQKISSIPQKWRPIIELAKENSNQHNPTIEQFFANQLPSDNTERGYAFMNLQTTMHNQVGYAPENKSVKQGLLTHLTLAYCRAQKIFYQKSVQRCEERIQQALEKLGKSS